MIPALCTRRSMASVELSRMPRASSLAKVSTIARTLNAVPLVGMGCGSTVGIVLNHRRSVVRLHSDDCADFLQPVMTGKGAEAQLLEYHLRPTSEQRGGRCATHQREQWEGSYADHRRRAGADRICEVENPHSLEYRREWH